MNNEKFEREGKTTKDNKGNCQCHLSAQGTGWVVVHKSSADGTTKLNLSKRSPWPWLLSSPLWILLMPPYLHLQAAATRAQILETNLLLVGSFWPRLKMDNQQTTSTHMPPPPLTHLLYHLHDFKSTSYFVVTCISPNYHLMCQWFFQVTSKCLNEVQKAKKPKKLIFSSDLPKCIVPHFAQVPYQINEISSTSSDKDSRGHFRENKK